MKTSITNPNLLKPSFKPWALLLWLLLWQGGAMALNRQFLLASPVQVFFRLAQLVKEISFWNSIFFSSGRILGGFLLGLAAALTLAALCAKYPLLIQILQPPMLFIKAAPVASFIILCLIWISAKNLSLFISFLMVLPVIYTNALEGIARTDPNLLEVARIFRLSPWRRLRYIYLPQILPYLRSACHLALGLCWKAGIAAEVIGIPRGSIGEKLYTAKVYLESADLFAWTFVIILLSMIFDRLFLYLMNRILWKA